MTAPQGRKKVELIIDEAAEDLVIKMLEKLHVKGYTLLGGVSGKGERGRRRGDDPFGSTSNLMMMTVTTSDVADQIVEASLQLLTNRAGIVLVSDVTVFRSERF